jgi:hypothetical protein
MDLIASNASKQSICDDVALDVAGYTASFHMLWHDFETITEFVEPANPNAKTYSHRLYELILRACTDFESVCRDRLESQKYGKSRHDMTIADYAALEETLHLSDEEVVLYLWRPAPLLLRPFKEWQGASKSNPKWYGSYNAVKHNRSKQFEQANLSNCVLAIAGLFAILGNLKILQAFSSLGSSIVGETGRLEFSYYPYGMSRRVPRQTGGEQ